MKPRNRLHKFTKWPENAFSRREMAKTDIDFCTAIARIMDSSDGLSRILDKAFHVKAEAEATLLGRRRL